MSKKLMQEIPCEHRFMLNWQRETVKIKYFDYIHVVLKTSLHDGYIVSSYWAV